MRKALFLTLVLAGLVVMGDAALAQGSVCDLPESAGSSFCQNQDDGSSTASDNPVINILSTVVRVLSIITGIVSSIVVVISAIMFTTAGGDSGRVGRARSALTYGLVGLIISIFAGVIVGYVLSRI